MQTQKLYYTKYFSPETLQIIITADFANVKLELNEINKKYDNVNLVTKQGVLNRTNAILKYLTAGKPLNGVNTQERTQLDSWYEFFNIQLLPVLTELYGQVFGEKPTNQTKYTYSLAEINKSLKTLDQSLKFRSFFIGHNITIFDITLVCYLENLFKLIVTQSERKKLINLIRWYNHVRSIPLFGKYLGKVNLCGKQAFKIQFNTELKPQLQTQVKKQQPKEAKKKQQKAKIQQVAPKTQEIKEKKEEVNVFKFDDLKREFQNSQNQLQVLQNLLANFDKEKISVWKIHYDKDPSEGKVLYMTQNLANGSLQRIQNIRKSAFGTWGVYGQQGNFEIRGVMIWQGTQIHPVWKEHPSFEYHKFTKLDPQNEKDKQMIIDYIMEAKSAEGLPLQSAKRIL